MRAGSYTRVLGIAMMVAGLQTVATDGWAAIILGGVFGGGAALFGQGILAGARGEQRAERARDYRRLAEAMKHGTIDGRRF